MSTWPCFRFFTILQPLLLLILVEQTIFPPAGASQLHYGVNIQGLEKLAETDFKIVQFLLELTEGNKTDADERLIRKYISDVYRGLPDRPLDKNLVKNPIPQEDPGSWIKKCDGHTARAIAENPLSAFRILHRFLFKIPKLKSMLKLKFGTEILETFKGLLPEILPDSTDLKEAQKSILRLYHWYNLKVPEYSRGELRGISTGVQFDAVHCEHIARGAIQQEEYALAIQWLWEAQKRLTNGKDDTIEPKVVQQKLIKAIKKHNFLVSQSWDETFAWFLSELNIQNEKVTSSKFAKGLEEQIQRFEQRREQNWQKILKKQSQDMESSPSWRHRGNSPVEEYDADMLNRFKSLCLGENFQTPLEKSRLFCWYEYHQSLFYLIGPMKMEFLSRNPDVVQVYNVSGPQRLKQVEDQVQGQLYRGSYQKVKDNEWILENSDSKISMDHYATEQVFDMGRIDDHIRKVPKINNKSATYSFSLYAFGGLVNPHIDSICTKEVPCGPSGDSFSFHQVFLENTELGGQTAFPAIGAAAQPIGGSLIIWYNVIGSGEPDYKTLHAGCPILLGRKFLFFQTEQHYDQFLEYKCPLREDERVKVKVNGKVPSV